MLKHKVHEIMEEKLEAFGIEYMYKIHASFVKDIDILKNPTLKSIEKLSEELKDYIVEQVNLEFEQQDTKSEDLKEGYNLPDAENQSPPNPNLARAMSYDSFGEPYFKSPANIPTSAPEEESFSSKENNQTQNGLNAGGNMREDSFNVSIDSDDNPIPAQQEKRPHGLARFLNRFNSRKKKKETSTTIKNESKEERGAKRGIRR